MIEQFGHLGGFPEPKSEKKIEKLEFVLNELKEWWNRREDVFGDKVPYTFMETDALQREYLNYRAGFMDAVNQVARADQKYSSLQ